MLLQATDAPQGANQLTLREVTGSLAGWAQSNQEPSAAASCRGSREKSEVYGKTGHRCTDAALKMEARDQDWGGPRTKERHQPTAPGNGRSPNR